MMRKKQSDSPDCDLRPGEIRNALAESADHYDKLNKNKRTAPKETKSPDKN